MPYLLSYSGIQLVRKYLYNWYALLGVYLRILPSVEAKFKDGKVVTVSKNDYSEFREYLFKVYLEEKGFKFSRVNNRTHVVTNNGVKMYLLPDYTNVLDEIYLRKAYGEKLLEGRPVIDIGSSIGDSSLYFAKLGAKEIHAFESDSTRFQLAAENIDLNEMKSVIRVYHQHADSQIIELIIKSNSLSHIFLKLDCEGCEYEIISNLPIEIFQRIDDIVLEYHDDPSPIIRVLKNAGYAVTRSKQFLVHEGLISATIATKRA